MPRHVINLNDSSWQFGQVACCPFDAADVYDLPAVDEWLPATVPGNVRTDLLALNRIPDPFFDEDYKKSLWVEDSDWWYRRRIEVGLLPASARAFVVFEGIDYLSAIFINGREAAWHEGMFSRQVVEITQALQTGEGRAEIAVRLWGSSALPQRQLTRLQKIWRRVAGKLHGSWVGVYPDRSATLKCQMSFGWDFAPPIRTMGIWDNVSLVITGPVFIEEVRVIAQPQQPEALGFDGGEPLPAHLPANFIFPLTLNTPQPCRIQAAITLAPANFDGAAFGPFHFSLDLPAGTSTHTLRCHAPDAVLWQPWDRGQPRLYTVKITVTHPNGETPDEVELRTGVRHVALNDWQFVINGQPEFMRGVNWVPADCFPGRLRRADYQRLLTMARDSGANFIRVWGGGLREKQAFYDLCDELGLLVWQEFPFACMFLGAYPRDAKFLTLVEQECGAIVRQLTIHPSVIAWCGGNEFSRLRNRPLFKTLARMVEQFDGSRPFIPTSPSPGDTHNWHVWHGDAPIQTYQQETARFLSEFGLQALPHPDTLEVALSHPTVPQSWPTHHANVEKLTRYASLFNEQLTIPKGYTVSNQQNDNYRSIQNSAKCTQTNFKTQNSKLTIQNSQLAQAVALQTAIEHMRCRKGEAGGVCLWQFNEPWPAISWAIVDYFGRPKLAYERLKNWYNPLLVCLKFPVSKRRQPGDIFAAQIWAINDTLSPISNLQLLITLDTAPIHTQPVALSANSAQCVGVLNHHFTAPPAELRLTLQRGSEIVCQNSYLLNWRDTPGGRITRRLRRRIADWVMR